ncbi:MAG: 4Fe-4S dicluster domain-containing protein [Bacteroidales bacterium]|nr:4Fe-4S dicluster domain-containing protein [Bacteroidales bacterium]
MNFLQELKKDIRFQEGIKNCINCGMCTAICPAAEYYEYDPRQIMEIVQRQKEEEIINLLKDDTIWYCGECISCKARCPKENVPAYIIQSLKTLSVKSGLFKFSKKGLQQIALLKMVGYTIINTGYCVHFSHIDTKLFPEQGPVWDWIKENYNLLFENFGIPYNSEKPGPLRKIPDKSLIELRKIFEVTGGLEYFNQIEKIAKEYSQQNNIAYSTYEKDELFNKLYNE